MNNKSEKKSIIQKIMLIIFFIAFLIFILHSLFSQLKMSAMSFTIKRGRLADEEMVKGIFVRKEEILGEDGNLRLDKIKSEGSRVSKGDDVFRYYSEDEQKVTLKIDEINKEINKYLQSQKINISSPENQVINEQIRKIIEEITRTSSQAKNIESLNNISEKLTDKAKNGNFFENDENINRLNKEKAGLENKLNENTKILKSPFAGIVSYKIDGFEGKLRWDDVLNLKEEDLKKLNIKAGSQIPVSDVNGKVVDNFSMYVVTKTNNKNTKNKKEGEYIKLRIQDDIINAEIIKLPKKDVKDDHILILKITQNVEKLIDTRSTNLDLIWWEKEGLKVSNQAIEEEKGFHFVEKNKLTYKEKVMVKIVEKTEEFSLVENYTSDELKELGIDISSTRPYVQEDDELIIQKDKTNLKNKYNMDLFKNKNEDENENKTNNTENVSKEGDKSENKAEQTNK